MEKIFGGKADFKATAIWLYLVNQQPLLAPNLFSCDDCWTACYKACYKPCYEACKTCYKGWLVRLAWFDLCQIAKVIRRKVHINLSASRSVNLHQY